MPTVRRLLVQVLFLVLPLLAAPGCYSTSSYFGDGVIREGSSSSAYGYVITFPSIKPAVTPRAEYVFGGAPPENLSLVLGVSETDKQRLNAARVHVVLRAPDGTVLFDASRAFARLSPFAPQQDDPAGIQMLDINKSDFKLDGRGSYHLTIEIENAPSLPVTVTPFIHTLRWRFVL